jgi:hypothetical protein
VGEGIPWWIKEGKLVGLICRRYIPMIVMGLRLLIQENQEIDGNFHFFQLVIHLFSVHTRHTYENPHEVFMYRYPDTQPKTVQVST